MSKLVIVESPAKAKTITKYLGKGYEVAASTGHLRDLPKSTLGVDVENNFEPRYIPIRGKSKLIKELAAKAAKSSAVFLATDPDREGEAISWHLKLLLKLDGKTARRVTFNEVTKNAVLAGMKNPRDIDENLVDSYQARRVLDRLVGYKLSPLLWKKIKRGLSAGRVQSVATRLVVDREEEIRAFVPAEYWTIDALLNPEGKKEQSFRAKYYGTPEGKQEIKNREEADGVLADIEGKPFVVASVKRAERLKNPSPPFITSSLQQEASRRLGYTSKKTMMIAQTLYEGVSVEGQGLVGLITYMRTDSLRLSSEIVDAARDYIKERFGDAYVPSAPKAYKSRNNAQDAHEAIRPTSVTLEPDAIKMSLTSEQYRLYKLIWERFVACQMASAVLDTTSADIGAGGQIFRATGYVVKFPGFTSLYEDTPEGDAEAEASALPPLEKGDALELQKIIPEQKFTQPPARYTEATLIRALEENGIGRPSTFAPTIATITDRDYVVKEGKSLKPTPLGEIVTNLMKEKFADIINVEFTAKMEEELDDIEEGSRQWVDTIKDFYADFSKDLEKAEEELKDVVIKVPEIESDVVCELCGRNMIIKSGRFGKFLACPGYPECKNTKPLAQETPGICPVCGSKIQKRKSKNGNTYYGCENNPKCPFMTWDTPLKDACPQCGKTLFRKYTRAEKKIYCAAEGCGYEIPYVRKGKGKKTEQGEADEG